LALTLVACAAPRLEQDAPRARSLSLRAAFNRMPMPSEGRARSVENNVDAWVTRWKIIEGASRSLDVQYFIIEPDAFGLAFLGLLHEKRGHGVDLRLMVDSRGTPGLTRAFAGLHLLSELAGAGAEVRAYNTIETQLGTFARGAFRNAVASNHDKLIIEDGRTSLLGGRNIAADYLSDPRDRPTAFIDVDVTIEGRSVAAALTRAFTTELHEAVRILDTRSAAAPAMHDRVT
jgi:putative cardiolipin synthase